MIHERRSGCPSDRHGTARARQVHGCTCRDSLEAARVGKDRWRQSPLGMAYLMALAERQKRERAESREWDRGPRFEAVRALSLAGESAAAIAVRLGTTERTVQRYRAKLREQGRLPQLTSVLAPVG